MSLETVKEEERRVIEFLITVIIIALLLNLLTSIISDYLKGTMFVVAASITIIIILIILLKYLIFDIYLSKAEIKREIFFSFIHNRDTGDFYNDTKLESSLDLTSLIHLDIEKDEFVSYKSEFRNNDIERKKDLFLRFIEYLIIKKYIVIALFSISGPKEETKIPGIFRRKGKSINLESLEIPKELKEVNVFINAKLKKPEFKLFAPKGSVLRYTRKDHELEEYEMKIYESKIRIFNNYFEMNLSVAFDSSLPISNVNVRNISGEYDLYFYKISLVATFNKNRRLEEILKIRKSWFESYYIWIEYIIDGIEKYLRLINFEDNLKLKP